MQRRKRSIGGHLARAGRAAALVVAAGAAVPVSARADRRLPHMAARRAAPPQLAVGLRRDRRRAEAGVAGRVQLPQQLGVLGSERPSGPHSRRTPIHGATGVDAELAPLDQLTGASAQPLAERLRAGGHLHRELERVAVLSQRPAVSTAQVRASHGAKPLAAEMALDPVLVGVTSELAELTVVGRAVREPAAKAAGPPAINARLSEWAQGRRPRRGPWRPGGVRSARGGVRRGGAAAAPPGVGGVWF
jgi:hypothetical protein